MKIKSLVIENFKSIERIELIEPNPFTVFVGPNGSGKSNIFEALEFVNTSYKYNPAVGNTVVSLYGGLKNVQRRQDKLANFNFKADLGQLILLTSDFSGFVGLSEHADTTIDFITDGLVYTGADELREQFLVKYARIFVGNDKLVKLPLNDDQRLSLSANNLEKVLKRILANEVLRNEVFEWLELFVPGFKAIEIDDRNELHWFEEFSSGYFTKDLISDGTYNILALLTAVYQSDDKPQFLCIEEPENGLHPQVARELIDFFRIMCEERGHYIWLNTHSQSMVSRLKPEEMIVVEKKQGATQITQFKGRDMHGLRMDEALLMNVLGVGLAW